MAPIRSNRAVAARCLSAAKASTGCWALGLNTSCCAAGGCEGFAADSCRVDFGRGGFTAVDGVQPGLARAPVRTCSWWPWPERRAAAAAGDGRQQRQPPLLAGAAAGWDFAWAAWIRSDSFI